MSKSMSMSELEDYVTMKEILCRVKRLEKLVEQLLEKDHHKPRNDDSAHDNESP